MPLAAQKKRLPVLARRAARAASDGDLRCDEHQAAFLRWLSGAGETMPSPRASTGRATTACSGCTGGRGQTRQHPHSRAPDQNRSRAARAKSSNSNRINHVFSYSLRSAAVLLVFRPDYPGYKPDVKELPNGDGKIDDKKYAHIALKYLAGFGSSIERNTLLRGALPRARARGWRVADAFEVPQAYRPDMRYDGPSGCWTMLPAESSHPHRDFNLFTLQLYRDKPQNLVADLSGIPEAVQELNKQCVIGEMGGAARARSPATLHQVTPLKKATQNSIVYFAIPDWDAQLPGIEGAPGESVKSWLNRRM